VKKERGRLKRSEWMKGAVALISHQKSDPEQTAANYNILAFYHFLDGKMRSARNM
jgi:hypothetical protein